MLSKIVVHQCRQCGSERLRKNGHANNGAQRARCLECGRTFILEPKGPRYDEKFKDQPHARGINRDFVPYLREGGSRQSRLNVAKQGTRFVE